MASSSNRQLSTGLHNSKWASALAAVGLHLAAACSGAVGPADSPWPMWGHDARHTHQSPYRGPRQPKTRWEFRASERTAYGGTDNTFYGPAIGPDGSVYVAGPGGKLYALDGASGAVRWQFQARLGFWATPAVSADGTVYASAVDGTVYALDQATGTKRWELALPAEAGGLKSSPALGNDGILVVQSRRGLLVAIDTSSGTLKWEFSAEVGDVDRTPAIAPDGSIVASAGGGWLCALDPGTGRIRWEGLVSSDRQEVAIGPDGVVFAWGGGQVLALDGATGARKWGTLASPIGGVADPALLTDGTVFCGMTGAFALAGSTGRRKWQTLGAGQGIAAPGEPVIDRDGIAYVGGACVGLRAVDASSGTVLWQMGVSEAYSRGPALGADGTLYVGLKGCLRAIADGPADDGPQRPG